jgi:hypothetical protein
MIIGFTGSRTATFLNSEILAELKKLNKETDIIIHGGARGADELVSNWCKKAGVNQDIIRPIDETNKLNYLFRNIEIISHVDQLIAYWDGKSRGTKFTIDYARARGKEVKVIRVIE